MAQVLRQSTQIIVRVGPAVAVGDGFTPVTSLSLSTADEAELLKANTTTTTSISGATMAAITGCDGWYGLTLTTSHTDTVGPLDVMINDDSLILPIFARFQVIEEAAYDAIYAASAAPATAAGVSAVETDTQDIQSRLPAALVGGRIDATVDGTGMEAAAAAVIVDAWEAQSQADPTGFHVNVMEVGGTAQTANDNGADINAILADTADMQPKLGTFSDLGAGATLSGNLEDMRDNGTAAFDRSTDSLQAIRDRGDAAWVTGTSPSAADIRAEIDSNSTQLAAIVADTNELQTDWADGGRLDLILDARASQASVDTVDGIVDDILLDTAEIGAAGVGLTEAGGTGDQLTALATAAALSTVDGIADNLVSGIIFGAAATGTLSTTVATSNLTGYADDQLIGRVIIWLTGDCEGEASRITDYAETNGTLTFDALTTAPGDADTFKIV